MTSVLPSASEKNTADRLNEMHSRRVFGALRHLLNLREDADEEGTVNDIRRSSEFRGGNLWALVFAILLASIGLNTNSAAVIIGAMLISPLMGPIMGVGLALGTSDLELFKRSLRHLLVAVSISVFTSALYFALTPLDQAQSELLARTQPTLFDALIAICGGSIGIIASSRREKTNAIPGVAIATALMPPLCTAGYGLANGHWEYFLGAFYLFFINSVFICVSTVVFVRLLKFKQVAFVDLQRERRVHVILTGFALLALIPSTWAAWELVQETLFNKRAQAFLAEQFHFDNTQIIKSDLRYDRAGSLIRLTLIGEPLSLAERNRLAAQLARYQLAGTQVQWVQPGAQTPDWQQEFQVLNQNLKTEIVEELYKENVVQLQEQTQKLKQQQDELTQLQQQLKTLKAPPYPLAQILAELKISHPGIDSLVIEKVRRQKGAQLEEVPLVLVHWQRYVGPTEKARLLKFLKLRLAEPKLELVVY